MKDGLDTKEMKHAINAQWIYPPADSTEAPLAKAGQFSSDT